MKPGGVVSLKKFNVVSFFCNNKLLILMIFVFVGGFLVSSILAAGSKVDTVSKTIYNSYISDRKDASFISIFFASFLKYLAACIVCFLTGTSVGGIILSPIISFSVGFYFGTLSSYLCSSYALKGVAFNSVILIPPALVFSLCFFFIYNAAFDFSEKQTDEYFRRI